MYSTRSFALKSRYRGTLLTVPPHCQRSLGGRCAYGIQGSFFTRGRKRETKERNGNRTGEWTGVRARKREREGKRGTRRAAWASREAGVDDSRRRRAGRARPRFHSHLTWLLRENEARERKRERETQVLCEHAYTYSPYTKCHSLQYRVLKTSHDRRAKLSPRPTRMNCDDHAWRSCRGHEGGMGERERRKETSYGRQSQLSGATTRAPSTNRTDQSQRSSRRHEIEAE